MIKNLELMYDEMCILGFEGLSEKCKIDPSFIFGRDDEGNTLLHFAAFDGNMDAVNQLMLLGACPFIYNALGMTPLSNAAGCNNVSALEFLLKRSHAGIVDFDKAIMMAIAASKGKFENLELMLNEGFDCNTSYREDPIIFWAMQSASIDVVQLLCEHGASINAANTEGMTLLYDASANGLVDIAEYLLGLGACIDKSSKNGSTPIIIASCYNQIDIAKTLILHKCDINKKCNDGVTALLYAIGYGYVELVQLLLDNGADKDATDKMNRGAKAYCKRIKSKLKRNRMEEALRKYNVPI